jgi:hypothetical protein
MEGSNKLTKLTKLTIPFNKLTTPLNKLTTPFNKLTTPFNKQAEKKRNPPMIQMAQKCAFCDRYIHADEETDSYNGDLDEYQGWMCHASCTKLPIEIDSFVVCPSKLNFPSK